jgi:signal transduction histidine kinase
VTARERLHRRFVAEEVTAALRHRLVNKLAGLGALAFHLRGQLPEGQLSDSAAAVLPLLDVQIGEATAALELRFLPPPPAAPDPVPLAAALAAAMRSCPRLPGVELEGPPPDDCTALVDPAELDLALFCLLENAVEALAGRGGSVQVRARVLLDEEGMVAAEVSDGGPGIPPLARDPFFTTRPGRLGLGVNVASRVALRARGRLELEGATARLVLPQGPP